MPSETWGPYESYEEVETSHGTFGVPAGKILSFERGRAVFADADEIYHQSDDVVFEGDASGFMLTNAGDAEFDMTSGDDEDAVAAEEADAGEEQ